MNTSTVATYNPNEQGLAHFFDKSPDPLGQAMALADQLAKSKALGAGNPGDALLIVLTCMGENMRLMDFPKKYHIIEGKLSMRSDAMLAEFRRRGGKHRWVEDGENGQRATIELSQDGESYTAFYSIEMARSAGLVRSGSRYERDPATMLRARAVTRGMRAFRPEIAAGLYSEEEIEEAVRHDPAPDNGKAADDLAARRAALQATAAAPAPAESDDAIDVEHEPAPAPAPTAPAKPAPAAAAEERQPGDETEQPAEQTPAPAASGPPITEEQYQRIGALCQQLEIAPREFIVHLEKETGVARPRDLTTEQAAKVIAGLEEAAAVPFDPAPTPAAST